MKSIQTNEEFRKDLMFVKACELAKVPPTRRQASKFRRGTGRAYAFRKEALGGNERETE